MAENRVIGKNNQLPWHLPADLKHFKAITLGSVVLMGRKTFESIGKPLPNRLNLILSRNRDYQVSGCVTVTTIEEALQYAQQQTQQKLFVIGGADIFQQTLPYIDQIFLTVVHHECDGDAYFPHLDENEWKEMESETHGSDVDNIYDYSFVRLERIST